MGKECGRFKSRNMYKVPMDKAKWGGRIECERLAVGRVGEGNGTTVIEQQ